MTFLEVKNLTKTYNSAAGDVNAVNDVNLKVNKGEFIAIVGSSGCGKSTLLYLLAGIEKPTLGQILFDGKEMFSTNDKSITLFRRDNIGLVYQFYNLLPILSLRENITLPLELSGKNVDNEYVDKLLRYFTLIERADFLPSQLSGGQQQRAAFIRAIIQNPALILADEPTGNLDSKNSDDIMNMIKQIHKTSLQTIILVTHDLTIAKHADRILTMEDGKIVNDEVFSK